MKSDKNAEYKRYEVGLDRDEDHGIKIKRVEDSRLLKNAKMDNPEGKNHREDNKMIARILNHIFIGRRVGNE